MFKKILASLLVVALYPLALLAVDLSDETLAGIKPADNWAQVKAKHGEPSSQKSEGYTEEIGCHFWSYNYKTKGLEFWVCHEKKDRTGAAGVASIRAYGESEANTSKGIGLGASREEVEKAYGKANVIEENILSYYHNHVHLLFTLDGGKVKEINLGVSE
jgi:hypothetical protein